MKYSKGFINDTTIIHIINKKNKNIVHKYFTNNLQYKPSKSMKLILLAILNFSNIKIYSFSTKIVNFTFKNEQMFRFSIYIVLFITKF